MFSVYFQYSEDDRDFLNEFPTRAEAEAYVAEQVELEGWEMDDPEATQYVIEAPNA